MTTLVSGAAASLFVESCSGCEDAGLTARSLLKASHPDVAVEACAVLDLKPLDGDVAAELGGLSERQLVACREHAFDIASNRDVVALDQGLDVCARANFEVARHPELAFGATLHTDRAVVVQLALEAVARTERELALSFAASVYAVL